MRKFLTLTLVLFLSPFMVGESRGKVLDVILQCLPSEENTRAEHILDKSIRMIVEKRYYMINSKFAYQLIFKKTYADPYKYEIDETRLTVSESDDMKLLKLNFFNSEAYFEFDRETLSKTLRNSIWAGHRDPDNCEIVDMSQAEFDVYLSRQLDRLNKISNDKRVLLQKLKEESNRLREERKQEAIEEQLRKNKI